MIVTRALPEHIEDINKLISTYGFSEMPVAMLNKHDISLIAKEDDKILGFVWCGLMGQKTCGYIDYFVIDPKAARLGVGKQMATHLVRIIKRKGVQKVLAIIAHNEFHDRSLASAVYMGLKPAPLTFTSTFGDVLSMANSLGVE